MAKSEISSTAYAYWVDRTYVDSTEVQLGLSAVCPLLPYLLID